MSVEDLEKLASASCPLKKVGYYASHTLVAVVIGSCCFSWTIRCSYLVFYCLLFKIFTPIVVVVIVLIPSSKLSQGGRFGV